MANSDDWRNCALQLTSTFVHLFADTEDKRATTEDKKSSQEVDAEMAADLLRANVSLEGERDQARDEVEQMTAESVKLRAELDVWQTRYRQAQQELDDSEKRLTSTELEYNKLSSKYDVSQSFVNFPASSIRLFCIRYKDTAILEFTDSENAKTVAKCKMKSHCEF